MGKFFTTFNILFIHDRFISCWSVTSIIALLFVWCVLVDSYIWSLMMTHSFIVRIYHKRIFGYFQVMIDFQAAERQRMEEPASEIGLEPLCAMVRDFSINIPWFRIFCNYINIYIAHNILWWQINNNLRCYDLAMELSTSTIEALPPNYGDQVMLFPFRVFCYWYCNPNFK